MASLHNASLPDDSVSLPNVVNTFKNNTSRKQIMVLNLFVDHDSQELKIIYLNAAHKHNLSLIEDPHFCNSGFDLFLPEEQTFTSGSVNKASFKVKCSAKICNIDDDNSITSYFTGYPMHPRSSLSKTALRLANSTGIIDAGYRGHLIGMFDVIQTLNPTQVTSQTQVSKFDRYLQICAPTLCPIVVSLVDTKDDLGQPTERGDGGFGSTGR
jgi:dUTP pyrophosphatase